MASISLRWARVFVESNSRGTARVAEIYRRRRKPDTVASSRCSYRPRLNFKYLRAGKAQRHCSLRTGWITSWTPTRTSRSNLRESTVNPSRFVSLWAKNSAPHPRCSLVETGIAGLFPNCASRFLPVLEKLRNSSLNRCVPPAGLGPAEDIMFTTNMGINGWTGASGVLVRNSGHALRGRRAIIDQVTVGLHIMSSRGRTRALVEFLVSCPRAEKAFLLTTGWKRPMRHQTPRSMASKAGNRKIGIVALSAIPRPHTRLATSRASQPEGLDCNEDRPSCRPFRWLLDEDTTSTVPRHSRAKR